MRPGLSLKPIAVTSSRLRQERIGQAAPPVASPLSKGSPAPGASPAPQGPAPSIGPQPAGQGPQARPGLRLAPPPAGGQVPTSPNRPAASPPGAARGMTPAGPSVSGPGVSLPGGYLTAANNADRAGMAPWQAQGGGSVSSAYGAGAGGAYTGQGLWGYSGQGEQPWRNTNDLGVPGGPEVGSYRAAAEQAAADYSRMSAGGGPALRPGLRGTIGGAQPNTGGEDPALLGSPNDGGYSQAGERQYGSQAGGQGAPGEQTSQSSTGYSGSGMQDFASYDEFMASGQGKPGDVVRYGSEAWIYLGDDETGDDMWQGPNGERLPTSETPWGKKQQEQFAKNNQDKATERLANDLGLNDEQRQYVDFLLGQGYGVDNATGDIYFKGEKTGNTVFDDPSALSGRLGNDYETYAEQNGIKPDDPLAEVKALLDSAGSAPEMDQSKIDDMVNAARRKQALESSQAMIMASEAGARSRLGPEATAGMGAEIAQRGGIEQANTEAKIRLESEIQNMQAKMTDYQNRLQNLRLLAAMSQDAQTRQAAIEAQKELMKYSAELQAEINGAQSKLASAFGMAGSGAAAGAGFGAMFGGIGAPVGAGVGGGLGFLAGLFA